MIVKKYLAIFSSKVDKSGKKRLHFKTFPNPVSDVIKFDFVGKNSFHVSIFDCKGAKVLETQLCIQKRQINVRKLPSGVYYLKVNSDKVNKFEKLIIQK